jgi:anti-sigma regulatory factor (Ser/Thr protein kinase)
LARRFAEQSLRDAPAGAVDSVILMVSELASNCIRHTDSGFELTITHTPDEIRVEATDSGAGEPHVRNPAPTDPDGRGLQIVDLLSDDWGYEPRTGQGKTVWFTVDLRATATAIS